MKPKFKIGDKVYVFPDTSTIYVVEEVKEKSVAFFYDLRNEKNSTTLSEVSEIKIQLV